MNHRRVCTSIETVGLCHQEVLSRPRLVACREVESNAFSIRNALWSRTEDDLLVQDLGKHSTSDVLFRGRI